MRLPKPGYLALLGGDLSSDDNLYNYNGDILYRYVCSIAYI